MEIINNTKKKLNESSYRSINVTKFGERYLQVHDLWGGKNAHSYS